MQPIVKFHTLKEQNYLGTKFETGNFAKLYLVRTIVTLTNCIFYFSAIIGAEKDIHCGPFHALIKRIH